MSRRKAGGRGIYILRSTCGEWVLRLGRNGIEEVVLPSLPPARGRMFSWLERRRRRPAGVRAFMAQVEDYLNGRRKALRLRCAPAAVPRFTALVLRRISEIPCGSTETYGDIARSLGAPRAARAVGSVCGANRLPLLVPCHRVVGGRDEGGYSAGLEWKRFLLGLEAGTIRT